MSKIDAVRLLVQKVTTLTPSGAELMKRLARGEKVAEVAADWEVSPRSVYRTLVLARLALGSRTDLESMVTWARNGYQADA